MLTSRIPQIRRDLGPAVNDGLEVGADLVAGVARVRAPIETGSLKASIHVENARGHGYLVVAGDRDVFYAHMVEHGTSHSAPQPFLVPALEQMRGEVLSRVRHALREAT
jgi:HK97 gp10 family phage protein